MKKLFLSILSALAIWSNLLATNYYVKPTGSDGAAGTSDGVAWQTVQKGLTVAVAGDTVWIESGTYDEDAGTENCTNDDGFRPHHSGSSGSPIVFKGYHGHTRPRIMGRSTTDGGTIRNMACITGLNYITFDSLEFTHGYRGIMAYSGVGIQIKYCKIDSTLGGTGGNNSGGIVTYSHSGGGAVSNWLVYGNEFFRNGDCDGGGDCSYSEAFNSSGMHLYGMWHSTIRKNIFHDQDNGIHFKGDIYGDVDFYDVLVDSNIFYDSTSGTGIDVGGQGTQDSIIIRNNLFYHVHPAFLLSNGPTGSTHSVRSVWIYNNTINGYAIGTGLQCREAEDVDSVRFFNNIIYRPQATTSNDYRGAIGFKNYVLDNSGCCAYTAHTYIDYNFYTLDDSTSTTYFGWTLNTTLVHELPYTTWKSTNLTGEGLLGSQDSHSSVGDPLFIDTSYVKNDWATAVANYSLQAGSPAESGGRGGAYPTYRGALGVSSPDITPPVISNIQVVSITSSGATITWDTDDASKDTTKYGLTSSYGTTLSNASYVTSHSQAISGLSASTTYHYRLASVNAVDSVSYSPGDSTFVTSSSGTLRVVTAQKVVATKR